jgi:hypothetical protein
VVRQRVMAELHRYRAGEPTVGREIGGEQSIAASREEVELLRQILAEIKGLRS